MIAKPSELYPLVPVLNKQPELFSYRRAGDFTEPYIYKRFIYVPSCGSEAFPLEELLWIKKGTAL